MKLIGQCNQCGLCCFIDGYRCINLIVTGELGKPLATKCGVYAQRYTGMPIVMVNSEGQILEGDTVCAHDSPIETQLILERGVGKGCSLIPVED